MGVDAGYSYKFTNKPVSQFYLGLASAYNKDGNRGNAAYTNRQFIFGAGINYGKYNGESGFIPSINLAYGNAFSLAKITVTPYSATPSLHLHFFNVVEVGTGYSFGYRKKNDFDFSGFVLNFKISVNLFNYYVNAHH